MKLTKSVVIHGFQFRDALKHSIKLCPLLGKHTGVVHITRPVVEKYMWGHKVIQPWGERLPLQCPKCGVLDPWQKPVFNKSNVNSPLPSYGVECKNPDCGKLANTVERYSFLITRPAECELLGSGDSMWLRVTL